MSHSCTRVVSHSITNARPLLGHIGSEIREIGIVDLEPLLKCARQSAATAPRRSAAIIISAVNDRSHNVRSTLRTQD